MPFWVAYIVNIMVFIVFMVSIISGIIAGIRIAEIMRLCESPKFRPAWT